MLPIIGVDHVYIIYLSIVTKLFGITGMTRPALAQKKEKKKENILFLSIINTSAQLDDAG